MTSGTLKSAWPIHEYNFPQPGKPKWFRRSTMFAEPLPHATIWSLLMAFLCCPAFLNMLILEDSKKKLSLLLFLLSKVFLCFMQT